MGPSWKSSGTFWETTGTLSSIQVLFIWGGGVAGGVLSGAINNPPHPEQPLTVNSGGPGNLGGVLECEGSPELGDPGVEEGQ